VFMCLMNGAAIRLRERIIGRAARMIMVMFVVVHRIARYRVVRLQ
jgi:hypothetical protein